ncbi:Fic family protein [Candidatus Enterococcus ferrettii]|uniref:Fido domain-containing protein n=1 Tax=Candidatus Enterococcus ferrettii TaxID=2815324 RepID=A0ABV0EM79_9ENTE|nr:Fic family protein [Enterococcus sp. 665A]MBO1342699.1 Fic family protein [Enterococcus sp. 665A]
MDVSQDYLDDVLVRMAYHSSGIEGNTISLPQTVSIILEGTLPSSGKSIREFYEIENHKQAFDYLIGLLAENQSLDIAEIKQFHFLLTDRLQHDKGQFKTQQNAIRGAEFKTAVPEETPLLMNQWADNTNYRLDLLTDEQEILEVLADTHIQFERIHPFSDGNGRTGRLLLMYLSMKYLGVPIVIRKEWRGQYMEYLGEQDSESLAKLFRESMVFECERMTEFP